jgi:hypothetical protein
MTKKMELHLKVTIISKPKQIHKARITLNDYKLIFTFPVHEMLRATQCTVCRPFNCIGYRAEIANLPHPAPTGYIYIYIYKFVCYVFYFVY